MIPTSLGIRRFTPIENERIMSWKDDWTKYGRNPKGEIVEISDAQRYKMCGNGVATKVVKGLVSEIFK